MLLILKLYIREVYSSLISFYISSNSCGSSCNLSCASNCYFTCLRDNSSGCTNATCTGGCLTDCTKGCLTTCGNSCGPATSTCGGNCTANSKSPLGCNYYCLHDSCGFSCGGDETIENVRNCVGLCISSSCSATGRE